ncbi:MAG: ABC transporter permease [Flavobacteriales bacterium]|nr:ABC transporter permease [Flavobacteriales bacterium]
MNQFITFIHKEFLHVFRDNKTMLMLFGLPIAQILLFGFALTNEIKNAEIIICDYDQSIASHSIIEKINASKNFSLDKIIISEKEILPEFKKGIIKLAIVFPNGFESNLEHFNHGKIQILADASDPNTATTLTQYINLILADYQSEINQNNNRQAIIQPSVRMLYNPELKGATNFVPGVMTLVLLLVCVLMTSVSIVKEKEMGTMEVLLVSPMHPFLYILSKAVPYFILSIINLTVILLMSRFLLDIPIRGNIFTLYFVCSIFILCALSLGLLISNSTNSQQTAMLISLMGMLIPTILLTGFMFPLENMPLALQLISNVLPSKWFYIIIKDVMIKGLGISAVWKETLILISMTLGLLLLSLKKFKIRME